MTDAASADIPAAKIRPIPGDDSVGLTTVGRLHVELLSFGPMAGLGERFIREVCYAVHARDRSLEIAVYEVDGEAVGFVAYTGQSISFHRESLRSHWLFAGFTAAWAVISDPRRLPRLLRALRVLASRRGEGRLGQDPMGEVVCIAVQPEFLKPKFVRRTGIRISEALIRYSAAQLRGAGVGEMRMLVDADNRAVLMLYHMLGATFEPYQQAGEPMVQVWFDLKDPTILPDAVS